MSGFDDLIPKLSGSSTPILDNPFADPFAGVGRPRSPDPWSTTSSYYQQGEPAQPDDPYANPYASEVPLAAPSYRDEALVASSLEEQNLARHIPEPSHDEEPRVSGTKEIDPLDVPSASIIEESVKPRGPFVPLPVVKASPKIQEPTRSVPPDDLEKPAPSTPISPFKTDGSDSPEKISLPPGLSEPASPLTPAATNSPLVSTPKGTSSVLRGPEEQDKPQIEPIALVSDSERSKSPVRTTSWDNPSLPPSPIGASSQAPAPQFYDNISSPLTTPAHQYRPVSVGALALGGEAPGWSSVTSAPMAHSTAQNDFGPPQFYQNSVEEDDDDDKPLAVTLENKLAMKAEKTTPQPTFVITVGDPQKVGDPISAHIVYTVTTKTTHPAFKNDSFSVLRRYSDFLWLYETLAANNPGVIVPPIPEKATLGRFEGSFVESRRLALNKCIQKIANHSRLVNDPDFKFFLESDTFALDIKHRRPELPTGGILATLGGSISGSKFYETDEWFDKKKTYLDTLEAQLRSLVKAIEVVAKQRLEAIAATQEFADAIATLAASGLSKHLSASLKVLAQLEAQAKELQESQTRDDLVILTGTADEYVRLIASVRLAFQSRVKTYHNMKLAGSERTRIRNANEKVMRQHTMDRQSALPLQREIEQVELKAQEARTKFEEVTLLCKAEMDRFERERINDFKEALERFLEGILRRQNEIIESWDGYQKLLLNSAGLNNEAP